MSISIVHPGGLAQFPRMSGGVRAGLPLAIRRVILSAFLCMGVVVGGLGAHAIISIAAVGRLSDQALDGALTSIGYARAALADFAALDAATARRAAHPNQGDLPERIARSSGALDENLAVIAQRASTPQAAQAATDAAAAVAGWRASAGLTAPGTMAGASLDAPAWDAPARDISARDALARFVNRRLERLVNHAAEDGLQLQERARAKATEAEWLVLLITGAAMVLGGIGVILLARRITQVVAGATTKASQLAQTCAFELVERPCGDAAERGRAEATISHMARHDALTGLPNRALLRESMDLAVTGLDQGHAFALLLIDLDHFKTVNDAMGFPAGDRVLQEMASRMASCLRKTETIARLGADEFAIMVPGLQRQEDAGDVARRIAEAVSTPCAVGDAEIVLRASIGIVMAPADGATSDTLLRKADLALHRAKQDGCGTVCFFEPGMDTRQQARRAMEADLRAGLANREFELFYQPLFDLNENRVCGFEALLRWSPTAGHVAPCDFIPVAEDTGLIVPIGEWVLAQACDEAATWPTDIKIAVNVSPVQFRSPFLVLIVQEALARSGLSAARLELEITESALMADGDATLTTLHQLRELGVGISMDDFGTGFSSLSSLHSFPFNKIKIDQSFVRDLTATDGSGNNAQAIVRAIAGLGSNLGMRTTAEGVETQEQLDRVRREGCTEVQGYLLSRPAPAREVRRLIAQFAPKALAALPA